MNREDNGREAEVVGGRDQRGNSKGSQPHSLQPFPDAHWEFFKNGPKERERAQWLRVLSGNFSYRGPDTHSGVCACANLSIVFNSL